MNKNTMIRNIKLISIVLLLCFISDQSLAMNTSINRNNSCFVPDEYDTFDVSKDYLFGEYWTAHEEPVENPSCPTSPGLSIVDDAGDTGYGIDMKLDSYDRPHISYSKFNIGPVKYARLLANGSWDIQMVDHLSGRIMTSLALDSLDRPHIAYLDWLNHRLKYATLSFSGEWQIEIVDDNLGDIDAIDQPAIVTDQQDIPHIVYYNRLTDSIMHAYKTPEMQWVVETIDTAIEGSFFWPLPSITIDQENNIRVAYTGNVRLKHAIRTSEGSWSLETLDPAGDPGLNPSLAIGADGFSVISYARGDQELSFNLMCARQTYDGWNIEVLDTEYRSGYDSSIAVDYYNDPQIAYISAADHLLKLMSFTSDGWEQQELVNTGEYIWTSGMVSLHIDTDDKPYIAFREVVERHRLMIYVLNAPPRPLEVDIGGPYYGIEGVPLQFHGSAQGGWPPYNFTWNFDDSSGPGYGPTPVHAYEYPGHYEVDLTVKDDDGNIAYDIVNAVIEVYTPGEVLFEYDVETPTGDDGCIGVEFDGDYFWVTGFDVAHGGIPKLYKFDSLGNYLTSYLQDVDSDWGWRDLAWDGEYLYASDENELAKIDPLNGQKIETLPMPMSPCYGLAYDADTDHFWAANGHAPLYEFDRNGQVIHAYYSNTFLIIGLAWDDISPDGPWLWTYSVDGEPGVQISQFNPRTGTYTGLTYQGVSHALTDAAGGACFYTNGTAGIFVGLTQNSPDLIFGMKICDFTNTPPDPPHMPDGNSELMTYEPGTYTTYTADPDRHRVQYRFDWDAEGNHEYSEWTPVEPSGHEETVSHSWAVPGLYVVRAQAKDEFGMMSDWSDGLSVTIRSESTPSFEIGHLKGGIIKISAEISNSGEIPVSDIEWSITVTGGILNAINVSTKGIIDELDVDGIALVEDRPLLGFGKVTITVTAEAQNVKKVVAVDGFVVLFFVIIR